MDKSAVADAPSDSRLAALLRYLDDLLTEAEHLRSEIGEAVRRRAHEPFWPERRQVNVPHFPDRRRTNQ